MGVKYKEIYISIINEMFPEKIKDPSVTWKLEHLDSAICIIELNDILFNNGDKDSEIIDSRLRSYTEDEIIRILKFQYKYKKTNTEIVKKYGISRTTLNTWQKRFKSLL